MEDHLSVSQIKLFLTCPLKYRFHYIDRLPKPFKQPDLALGSAIQAAVEWWHKERMINGKEPEWQALTRIFEADLKAQSHENLKFEEGETLSSLTSQGLKLLALYLTQVKRSKLRAVELPFRVPLSDLETGEKLPIPLEGYIHLIESPGRAVELKTAKKLLSPLEITQHLRLTGNAYACLKLYGKILKLRLDILTKGKTPALHSFEVERDKASLVRFFHLAKAVYGAIKAGHFYPKEGWQCKNCEYLEACQKWRTKSEITESKPTGKRRVYAKESV